MPTRAVRTLSFTPAHAAFMASCVESGRFQSASDVVRTALRLLQDAEALRQAGLERARSLVARGLEDLDRGAVIDGKTFFASWAASHRKRRQATRRRGK